jgi:hypothetical protein
MYIGSELFAAGLIVRNGDRSFVRGLVACLPVDTDISATVRW